MATISSGGVNSLYKLAFGRSATAKELSYWSGKDKNKLISALKGSGGLTNDFKVTYGTKTTPKTDYTKNASGSNGAGKEDKTPGDNITDAVNRTLNDTKKDATGNPVLYPAGSNKAGQPMTVDEYAKFKSYQDYYRQYGVDIPELTAEYGRPDVNADTTEYGIMERDYGAQQAMTAENYQAAMDSYELDRRQAVSEWTALQNAINTGQIDPNSQAALQWQQNLQQKTDAVKNTQKYLANHGMLYGGVGQVKTEQTAQPYEQQATQMTQQYQSAYDQKMAEYLNKSKNASVQYGMDNPDTGAKDFGYGGGKWDPATGKFTNVQFGLSPQQAQAAGLNFFGTDPYNILINRERRRQELVGSMTSGMAGAITVNRDSYLGGLNY